MCFLFKLFFLVQLFFLVDYLNEAALNLYSILFNTQGLKYLFELFLQAIIFSALVAATLALPTPDGPPAYGPPPPAYKPAPYKPHPAPYKEEKLPPQPFAYEYGVKDDYSGASYQKSETQDAYGVVGGSYTVALPDGRTQIVTYTADHEGGFIADVKYEGVAQYPPEPKEGYGHAPPAYHPAPPPKYAPAPAPAKRQ